MAAENDKADQLAVELNQVTFDPNNSADFANYFCTYGLLYHQKDMLTDQVRMDGYYNAIFKNKSMWEGKVVLDVGTGSGILAIWAAKAGARHVYAIEATDMAKHARAVAAHNGVGDKVTVIQGKMEDVQLPEKVDMIISEWMGYFLLRESMLDSVLFARDKWLNEGGSLWPSHAKIYLSVASGSPRERASRLTQFEESQCAWDQFTEETKEAYGVDYSCLDKAYTREHQEYYLEAAVYHNLAASQVLAPAATLCELDLETCTIEELKALVNVAFTITTDKPGRADGFAGWFDVDFKGSKANPAAVDVCLTTDPAVNYTHWGHQLFYFRPDSEEVEAGAVLNGTIDILRRKENQRMIACKITHQLTPAGGEASPAKTTMYNIE